MSMIEDIFFYVMVGLMPSMVVLGLLLRRNPFEQKPIAQENDELATMGDEPRSSGTS
jgi:hypothetical protein